MCLIKLPVVFIALVASYQAAASLIPTKERGTWFPCEIFCFLASYQTIRFITSHSCGVWKLHRIHCKGVSTYSVLVEPWGGVQERTTRGITVLDDLWNL